MDVGCNYGIKLLIRFVLIYVAGFFFTHFDFICIWLIWKLLQFDMSINTQFMDSNVFLRYSISRIWFNWSGNASLILFETRNEGADVLTENTSHRSFRSSGNEINFSKQSSDTSRFLFRERLTFQKHRQQQQQHSTTQCSLFYSGWQSKTHIQIEQTEEIIQIQITTK